MKKSGLVLANGSNLVGAVRTDFKNWNHGTKGVLVFTASAVGTQAQLVLQSMNSSIVVMGSSNPLGLQTVLELELPSGQYAINNVGSSTVNVFASLLPTR